MVEIDFIKQEYPLHWLVWQNDYRQLDAKLKLKEDDKDKRDNRGRTPLMLAVTLGHLESTRILLNQEANVNCESKEGWTVVQEAVSTGDPELLHMVLERRDFQRYSSRMAGIPELLHKLKEAPDFYVEMKWEFTSWVPLVTGLCPSDTYKVYKQGSNVRVDTTLLGFDHTSWQRGNRSYIFQGHSEGATMMEIDHDLHQVYSEEMRTPDEALGILIPNEESVSQRLTTPIVTTYVDTDKISFERNKAGMWGWRSDKSETINGHQCKVFSATNVELVTKTRTEHLTEMDKAKTKNQKHPLQNLLGIANADSVDDDARLLDDYDDSDRNCSDQSSESEAARSRTPAYGNPCNITPEDYFDSNVNLDGRDIGRPKEVSVKVQKFKANLWLCERYPLSLPEQILPIVDLMAISSTHFAKLKNFIQLQLPAGFPVKIEIPLLHVLNARITFGNIFAMDSPVEHVTTVQEDDRLTCVLDERIFKCPGGYTQIGNAACDGRRQYSMEEEDDLLQFAIQQSLIDAGTEREEVDIWEALKAQKPSRPTTPNLVGEEERQLQRAIQASLELYQKGGSTGAINDDDDDDDLLDHAQSDDSPEVLDSDLHMALMLSERERQTREQQRLLEEQQLQEILQLSLTEK